MGRCKLDPSLKATCFQPLTPEIACNTYSAFNLNLGFSELAPLHRGGQEEEERLGCAAHVRQEEVAKQKNLRRALLTISSLLSE